MQWCASWSTTSSMGNSFAFIIDSTSSAFEARSKRCQTCSVHRKGGGLMSLTAIVAGSIAKCSKIVDISSFHLIIVTRLALSFPVFLNSVLSCNKTRNIMTSEGRGRPLSADCHFEANPWSPFWPHGSTQLACRVKKRRETVKTHRFRYRFHPMRFKWVKFHGILWGRIDINWQVSFVKETESRCYCSSRIILIDAIDQNKSLSLQTRDRIVTCIW